MCRGRTPWQVAEHVGHGVGLPAGVAAQRGQLGRRRAARPGPRLCGGHPGRRGRGADRRRHPGDQGGSSRWGWPRSTAGPPGQTENCQVLPMLSYASGRGHAFIDRALYLPRRWTDDPQRCAQAGVPAGRGFLHQTRAGDRHAGPGAGRRGAVPLLHRRLRLRPRPRAARPLPRRRAGLRAWPSRLICRWSRLQVAPPAPIGCWPRCRKRRGSAAPAARAPRASATTTGPRSRRTLQRQLPRERPSDTTRRFQKSSGRQHRGCAERDHGGSVPSAVPHLLAINVPTQAREDNAPCMRPSQALSADRGPRSPDRRYVDHITQTRAVDRGMLRCCASEMPSTPPRKSQQRRYVRSGTRTTT